jgi:hypothetical protein
MFGGMIRTTRWLRADMLTRGDERIHELDGTLCFPNRLINKMTVAQRNHPLPGRIITAEGLARGLGSASHPSRSLLREDYFIRIHNFIRASGEKR